MTTAEKSEKKEYGAKVSQLTTAEQLKAYGKDHKRVAKESLQRILRQPVNSIMTWIVIGIALSLPIGFYVVLTNFEALGNYWNGSTHISLFLKEPNSAQEIERLTSELKSWPEIGELKVISKEQALEEFQAMSGFSDVLNHLEVNPLPTVIEISPKNTEINAIDAEILLKRLESLPLVEMAQIDLQWVKRLQAMLDIGRQIVLVLVILLSLGVIFIISNTIRLEIESRRKEIFVIKLIGGTDAFVRRPFLYAGLLYGLGGGVLATLIVSLSLVIIDEPIAKLVDLYQSDYLLLGVSFADIILLWFFSAVLGFFGAWFAVSKHLDGLEPR